ncbi:MAG: hypothetical protein PHQ35_09435 [Phycisphaerae bacterium]|nr:hypothetical protein [Phycisphaerae bacterium]MDD5239939.1 hypothetical protein [Candidatus Nanoarchaeia archaeon]
MINIKKRITTEQLQELTPKQQQTLRELWKPVEYDVCYGKEFEHTKDCNVFTVNYFIDDKDSVFYGDICTKETEEGCPDENGCGGGAIHCSCNYKLSLPLLSIGQMIELLGEYRFNLTRYGDLIWRFTLSEEKDFYGEGHTYELIDILWEAVKQIL